MNNIPYEIELKKYDQLLQKYDEYFKQCDFDESIDLFELGIVTYNYNGYKPSSAVNSYKSFGFIQDNLDPIFKEHMLTKNIQNIIPIIDLIVNSDGTIYYNGCDGIIGFYFKKPLKSDTTITFYTCNSDSSCCFFTTPTWEEKITIPKGTKSYKLPKMIYTHYFGDQCFCIKKPKDCVLIGTFYCNQK